MPRGTPVSGQVKCSKCGEQVTKKMFLAHLRHECKGIVRRDEEGNAEVPPGTIIGEGPAQHKKAWTWADLERAYPKTTWITIPAQSNPPGGIIWNGLHVELVPFEGGCFLMKGPRLGDGPVYSKGVPPPHWDAYQQSVRADREAGSLMSTIGFGVATGRQSGALEPQVFVDRETGERLVNPY